MSDKKCHGCGLCCKSLIIEADEIDAEREPRIAAECPPIRDSMDGPMWMVAVGQSAPCPFLLGDNVCSIYPTRPNECVAFPAGGEKCQELRGVAVPAAELQRATAGAVPLPGRSQR